MTPLQITAVLLLLSLGGWLLIALLRYRRKNIVRERSARGRAGEAHAHADLRRLFARVEAHPRIVQRLWVDQKEIRYELCPDFLVGSRQRPIIVEVKSGQDREPEHPTTRRQLIEYALAFGARRIGLYDARTRTLRWVRFECLMGSGPRWFSLASLFWFVIGIVLTLAVQHWR